MHDRNLATVEIKAFVPARDFERSQAFYSALGFTRASVFGDVAYFHAGQCSFLLQAFEAPGHEENFMMHLLVQSVDDWHAHVRSEHIAERFGVEVGEPIDQPWGLREFLLFDPSGVLWRIAQKTGGQRRPARPGAPGPA
jgi:catechol 2,3-dioxygenase-like lactoylglutathione lyase family enzyme